MTLRGADLELSVAHNYYISWQSTSTLLVRPLVTVIGPEALQSAVPPSYSGLRRDGVCTHGYGYRESTVVTDSNGGNVSHPTHGE